MLSREEQDLQVRVAMGHAAEGNAWAMLAHLQAANVLAGVKVSFRRRWPRLPDEEIDDMIGAGVDALFQKVSGGERVENPVGYILEVMRHEAADYTAEQSKIVSLDSQRDRAEAHSPADREADARSRAALELARSLLPKLGQESVQQVMGVILDAVETGRATLTAAEIAVSTGLTEAAVRQCRSRGFRRLARVVQEEGLAPDHSATSESLAERSSAPTVGEPGGSDDKPHHIRYQPARKAT